MVSDHINTITLIFSTQYCSNDMSQFLPRLKDIVTKHELSMALSSFSIQSTSEEIDKLWLMYDVHACA